MRRIPPPRTILRRTRHTSRDSRGETALRGLRIPHPEKAGKGTDLALLQPNPPEIDHLAISVSKFPSLLCLLSRLLPPPPPPPLASPDLERQSILLADSQNGHQRERLLTAGTGWLSPLPLHPKTLPPPCPPFPFTRFPPFGFVVVLFFVLISEVSASFNKHKSPKRIWTAPKSSVLLLPFIV